MPASPEQHGASELLAICIPTYNRAEKLAGCLAHLIEQAAQYRIPIHISDNASTDNTAVIVEEFSKRYDLLFYSRNDQNYGADYNIAKVLRQSSSRYAWLLGDDDRLALDAVRELLEVIGTTEYDLIVLNGGNCTSDVAEARFADIRGRVEDVASGEYNDPNRLLTELGWHVTWISCLVFSRAMLDATSFEAYYGSHLLQFSTVFSYLADRPIRVQWDSRPFIYGISRELPRWYKSMFEIWVESWCTVVSSLPQIYTEQAKLTCIKDHGIKGKLFDSWVKFMGYRMLGYYTNTTYTMHKAYFKQITCVPRSVLFLISLFPRTPLLVAGAIGTFLGLLPTYRHSHD